MSYATYNHYKCHFKGNAIPSLEIFDRLKIKASAYVDKITFGRITGVTDAVQNAVCAVCDVLYNASGHEGITSENNDGYIVNYADEKAIQKQLYQAAALFLPSELLYRGL